MNRYSTAYLSAVKWAIVALIFYFGALSSEVANADTCYKYRFQPQAWVKIGNIWKLTPYAYIREAATCVPVAAGGSSPTPYGDNNPACNNEEVTQHYYPMPAWMQNCPGTGYDRICLWYQGSRVDNIPLKCETTTIRCSQYTLAQIGKPIPAGYVSYGQCYTTATVPHQYVTMYGPPSW